MSATDELRRLLDERGVEHEDKHTELVPGISDWDSTWWRGIAGLEFHAIGDETFGRDGCVYINGTYLTPEQAITATLGSGTCEMEWVSNWMGWHCKACDSLRQGLPDQKPNYCSKCGAKVVKR